MFVFAGLFSGLNHFGLAFLVGLFFCLLFLVGLFLVFVGEFDPGSG